MKIQIFFKYAFLILLIQFVPFSLHANPLEDLLKNATLLSKKSGAVNVLGAQEEESLYYTDFKYPYLRVVKTVGAHSALASTGQEVAMVADHVLVRVKEGVSKDDLTKSLDAQGYKIRKATKVKNTYLVELPNFLAYASHRQMTSGLQQHSDILKVEPDYILYALETFPDDPSFSELWGLHNTGQTGGTPDKDIDAPEAWDIAKGLDSVIVGVIDTGIDYTHVDLVENMWVNPGEIPGDMIDNDNNGYIDDIYGWDFANNDSKPMDGHSHGTHCAGTIGGVGNNAKGVVGVCWTIRLMALKFISDAGLGASSDAIEAIAYATAMGVDLTSNSWGGGNYSELLKEEIERAYAAGIPFVAAAGNTSRNNDILPFYPSNYEVPNVYSVAAYDHNGLRAIFSSYGPTTVDLAAPGQDIYSSIPGDFYGSKSGTSMATPQVAGVVALMLSMSPILSPEQILNYLISTSEPWDGLNGMVVANGSINAFEVVKLLVNPFVYLNDHNVDDDAIGGTSGNDDGIINPGETIAITINARNQGASMATGVVATLTIDDPVFNVTDSQIMIGDLTAGENWNESNDVFMIDIAATPTPYSVDALVTFVDENNHTWSNIIKLTVYTSTIISGRVNSILGPVENARVIYTGFNSGEVLSAADGNYSIRVLGGNYSFTASKAYYVDDGPYVHDLVGNTIIQNFYLTKPELEVSTNTIFLTQKECESKTVSLVISNVGDGRLDFEILINDSLWIPQPDSLWHESSQRAKVGDISWFYGVEGEGYGFNNSGTLDSPTIRLLSDVSTFSFQHWRKIPFFSWDDKTILKISTDEGNSWENLLELDANTIEWKPVDLDISSYAGQKVRFRFFFDAVNDSYADEGWYVDDIRLNEQLIDLASVTPSSGSIQSNDSLKLKINFNTINFEPGIYQNEIHIRSNDEDESTLRVPYTITILPSPFFDLQHFIISDDDNANGQVEEAEQFNLFFSLINSGGTNATETTLTLSTTSIYFNILTNTLTLPSISSGETVTNLIPFQIAQDIPYPDGLPVDIAFNLNIKSLEGCIQDIPVNITLHSTNPPCEVILSEYIEGSSYNKAIEIYNGMEIPVDLSRYSLKYFFNGHTTPATTINLSGILQPAQPYIIAHNSAGAELKGYANRLHSGTWFNGNDFIGLYKDGVLIDSIGEMGNPDYYAKDVTLVRENTIGEGDVNTGNLFESSDWIHYPKDDFTHLLQHNMICSQIQDSPPIFQRVPDQTVYFENSLTFNVEAIPTDDNPVTMTASNLPPGSTFTSNNGHGVFTWNHAGPPGIYHPVFFATDINGTVFVSNTIYVVKMGTAPVWINEVHYDNESYDEAEGVEIAGPADIDLASYQIVFYNGKDGSVYKTQNLSGVIPDQQCGYGTLWFAVPKIQNGAPDGVALVLTQEVVQFISYEGSFIASDGPAVGFLSNDMGVSQKGDELAYKTLNLTGTGDQYAAFAWVEQAGSRGNINTNQTLGICSDEDTDGDGIPDAWEILQFGDLTTADETTDFDNDGVPDIGEYIAGTDPLDNTSYPVMYIERNGDADVINLSFPSTTGRLYTIEYNTHLTNLLWQYHSQTNATGTNTFIIPTNLIERIFYRLKVSIP